MGNYITPYGVPVGVNTYTWDRGSVTKSFSQAISILGNNVKNGSAVPSYIDRIRRGVDASSAYTRIEYNVVPGFVSMKSSGIGGGNNYYSYRREQFGSTGLPVSLSFNSGDVIPDASNRLKRKLREFTGQSNQLTNLVELKDLPRTLGSVAGSASKLVSTVLNSKRRGQDLKKFASDQWLTWSFGVLPTLGAIDDAMSSINAYLSRGDHKIKEYGIFEKKSLSSTSGVTTGSTLQNILYNGRFEHTLSCKITAGYKYSLLSSNSYNVEKHLGFDISSVIPTAYELLPYSWLVDYFTTAGSFIEDSFSADFGQSIYICQNVLYRVKGEVVFSPKKILNPSVLEFFITRPTKFEYFNFTRTTLANLPRAPLRFKTSDEIAFNAINKLLNLTALLGSKK